MADIFNGDAPTESAKFREMHVCRTFPHTKGPRQPRFSFVCSAAGICVPTYVRGDVRLQNRPNFGRETEVFMVF